jgi:hypothetical protein
VNIQWHCRKVWNTDEVIFLRFGRQCSVALLKFMPWIVGETVMSKYPSRAIMLINPLNAELNPICHSLILLGDLTFMGTCIVSIFQYISNKMQRYTFYLYLGTALHVSGGTSTHHQARIQLYLQHLVFVTPLLLSALVWGVAYATHSTLKPVPSLPR